MGKKILVVERDEAVAAAISHALENAGLTPVLARDRQGAVDVFARDRPAAVLIAVDLGRESGRDVCASIRARKDGTVVPILFLGTAGPKDTIRSTGEALGVGGDYFFRRPLDWNFLAERLRTWTRSAEPPIQEISERVVTDFVAPASALEKTPVLVEWTESPSDVTSPGFLMGESDDATSLVALGEEMIQRNERASAVDAFEAAAGLFASVAKIDLALSMFRRVLKIDPARRDIVTRAATMASAAGRKEEALNFYWLGVEQLEKEGDIFDAAEMCRRMLEVSPMDLAVRERLAKLDHRLLTVTSEIQIGQFAPPKPAPPPDEDDTGPDQPAISDEDTVSAEALAEIDAALAAINHGGTMTLLADVVAAEGLVPLPEELILDLELEELEPEEEPIELIDPKARTRDEVRPGAAAADDAAASAVEVAQKATTRDDVAVALPLIAEVAETTETTAPESPVVAASTDTSWSELVEPVEPVEPKSPSERWREQRARSVIEAAPTVANEPVPRAKTALEMWREERAARAKKAEELPEISAALDAAAREVTRDGNVSEHAHEHEHAPTSHAHENAHAHEHGSVGVGVEASDVGVGVEASDVGVGVEASDVSVRVRVHVLGEPSDVGVSVDASDGHSAAESSKAASVEHEHEHAQSIHAHENAHAHAHDPHEHAHDPHEHDPHEHAHDPHEHEPVELQVHVQGQVHVPEPEPEPEPEPTRKKTRTKSPRKKSARKKKPVALDAPNNPSPAIPSPKQHVDLALDVDLDLDASEAPNPRSYPPTTPTTPLLPPRGQLTNLNDALFLASQIRNQRPTGLLRPQNLVFADGHLLGLRDSRVAQSLLATFARLGRLPPDALTDLLATSTSSDRPRDLCRVLLARNLLTESECSAVLERHLDDALLSLLTHRGTWSFEQVPVAPEEHFPRARTRELRTRLIELLPRAASNVELFALLGGPRAILKSLEGIELIAAPNDARFLTLLDGRYPIEDALELSDQPIDRALSAAAVYAAFGLITRLDSIRPTLAAQTELPMLTEIPLPVPSMTPRAALSTLSRAPRPWLSGIDRADQERDLRALAEIVRSSDYFTILGVDPAAPLDAIATAHRRLRRSLRPEDFQKNPELYGLAREVLRSVDEAWDVLSVPELRAAYQQHLKPHPRN